MTITQRDASLAVFCGFIGGYWTGRSRSLCGWVPHACCWSLATWLGYRALGSDLLPEMDEGGFILDYIMPAGSSLTETNRVLAACRANSARHARG